MFLKNSILNLPVMLDIIWMQAELMATSFLQPCWTPEESLYSLTQFDGKVLKFSKSN